MESTQPITCPVCKTIFPADGRHCPNCGQSVTGDGETRRPTADAPVASDGIPAFSPEDAPEADRRNQGEETPDEEYAGEDQTPSESPGETPVSTIPHRPATQPLSIFGELAALEAGVAWNGVLLLMMWFFLFLTYFI